MKIILCVFLLEFIYVQSYTTQHSVLSELKKYGNVKITGDFTYLYCVYLDLNDFKDDDTLYFKITIHNGYWYDSYTRYNTYNYKYDSEIINLYKTQEYYSRSYGTVYNSYYYDYYTYNFKIDKPSTNDRYFYIGHPSLRYQGNYYVEIENVSGFGLSVAIIVVIVIAVVAIVAASIIVYFCRRARRASYIAPPVAQYQPPVAVAPAYPPPTYY